MDNKYIIGFVIAIVVIVGLVVFFANGGSSSTGPDLTLFAQCIKNSGATFYGAFWCPHCAATKRMFGDAVKYLPYVECSTPDGQGQTQVCIDKGIKSYPTWYFADGSTESGELTLQELSAKTNCPLPQSVAGGVTTAPSASSTSPAASSSPAVSPA